MFKKVKEFNDKNVGLYFFLAVFVLVFSLFINSRFNKNENKDTTKECTNAVGTISDSDKYSYEIKINKENEVVILSVKKYAGKILLEKTEKGKSYKYFIYYNDVYVENSDKKYVLTHIDNFVEGIDNKLLYLDYLNEISIKSKIDEDTSCYIYDSINMCIEEDNVINLIDGELSITYTIDNIGSTEDFDVLIDNGIVNEPVNEVKDEVVVSE